MNQDLKTKLLALPVEQVTLDILEKEKFNTTTDFVGVTCSDLRSLGIPFGEANRLVNFVTKELNIPLVKENKDIIVKFQDDDPTKWNTEKVLRAISEVVCGGGKPDLDLVQSARSKGQLYIVCERGKKEIFFEKTIQYNENPSGKKSFGKYIVYTLDEYISNEVLCDPRTGKSVAFSELEVLTKDQLLRFAVMILVDSKIRNWSDFEIVDKFSDDNSRVSKRAIDEMNDRTKLKLEAESMITVNTTANLYDSYTENIQQDNMIQSDHNLHSGSDSKRTIHAGRDYFEQVVGSVKTTPEKVKSKETLRNEIALAKSEEQLYLLQDKQNRLKKALYIETDVACKFKIETQLKELDNEIASIKVRIYELEMMLGK